MTNAFVLVYCLTKNLYKYLLNEKTNTTLTLSFALTHTCCSLPPVEAILGQALLVAYVVGALAGPGPHDPNQPVDPERVAHVASPADRSGPGATSATVSRARSGSGQAGAAASVGNVGEGSTGAGGVLVGGVGTAVEEGRPVQLLALGAGLGRTFRLDRGW